MFTDEQAMALVDKAVDIGFRLFTEKKYEEAEIVLTQAVKVNPDNLKGLQILGLMRYDSGRFVEAMETFRTAIEYAPENAENHNNISLCYYNLGKYKESVPHIEKAVRLAPGCAYMQSNLGLQYKQTGRWEEAAEHFKAALSIDAHNANVWCMLGRIHLRGKTDSRRGPRNASSRRSKSSGTSRRRT